mmetsp:Transcript_6401/g.13624  ORF Transcript_6401/g.13624 Transcript_6401/m.13624 type:complete len:240 (+) Transcript_6401:198-917(+)
MSRGLILAQGLKHRMRNANTAEKSIVSSPSKQCVDCAILSSCPKEQNVRRSKSPMKKREESFNHAKRNEPILIRTTSNQQISDCALRKSSRNVFFADEITVKKIKRIPRAFAKDVWYTAPDMSRFRMDVLNSEDLRLHVKLKSARCHNHMRRVLLEHRISQGGKATTTSVAKRISSVSIKSSEKPKEAAVNAANKLEQEIIDEQSYLNPKLSTTCFGFSQRWVFDYYLGSMIDNVCPAI